MILFLSADLVKVSMKKGHVHLLEGSWRKVGINRITKQIKITLRKVDVHT